MEWIVEPEDTQTNQEWKPGNAPVKRILNRVEGDTLIYAYQLEVEGPFLPVPVNCRIMRMYKDNSLFSTFYLFPAENGSIYIVGRGINLPQYTCNNDLFNADDWILFPWCELDGFPDDENQLNNRWNYIDINGTPRKRQYYNGVSIEGLGASDCREYDFWLFDTYYAYRNQASEYHLPDNPKPITLSDMYTGLLTKDINYIKWPENKEILDWPSILRDDRSWVYGAINPTDNSYYESYWRFGEWVQVGCCMYRPFYEYKRIIWNDRNNKEDFTITYDSDVPPVMLRDNWGRVNIPNDEDIYSGILYDFNPDVSNPIGWKSYKNVGYSFPVVNGNSLQTEANEFIWKTKEFEFVEIDGALRCKMTLTTQSGITYESIEGIGIINRGFMPYIYGEVGPDSGIPYLARYCDEEENTIHQFRSAPWENIGIKSSEVVSTRTDLYFDFHGRCVINPIPGNLYIRNGKKTIYK